MHKYSDKLPKVPPYQLLDAWRGLAALWVVMTHSCVPYIASGNLDALRNPIYGFSVMGQLGVVLFFIISGYCIFGAAYSCISTRKSVGRFAIDRVRRIYPPYLAACAAALLVGAITAVLQHWHIFPAANHPGLALPLLDIKFWLANLSLTQLPMGIPSLLLVAWSLCYEVIFYVIVGGLLFLSSMVAGTNLSQRSNFLVYAGILTTVASLVWLVFSPSTCVFPFDRWYQFGFGALLYSIISNGGWRSSFGLRATTYLCVILCLYYACLSASSVGDFAHPSPQIQAVVCLVFFLLLGWLQPFSERISRWRPLLPLMWLGTFSYSIYLIHPVVIPFPDAGMRKLGFDGAWYIITYFVQIITGLGAGWLFFILVEKHFISIRQEKRIEAELQTPVDT